MNKILSRTGVIVLPISGGHVYPVWIGGKEKEYETYIKLRASKALKVDETLIECSVGVVNYYRFLCFHPRNTNYVILLNHCEEPVRFY